MDPLPDDYWVDEAAALYAVVVELIEQAAAAGAARAARQVLATAGIEVDFTLLNERAYTYARQHAFDLVSQVTSTSRRALQSAFADWIASGEPLPALVEQLRPLFGPVRAEMIAVTEVTRVYAASNVLAWAEYGVDAQKWQTAVDDLVCEICGPYHDREYALGDPEHTPPAHVNCRCWLQPVIRVTEAAA